MCDGLTGDHPLPFGSPIYPTSERLPKFRADDLKKRAVDIEAWYDNFIVNGLPKTPAGKPPDSEHPFEEIGGGDGEPRGQLGKIACSILMRILYAARLARFDLLRITCKLATRVSKWTEKDDARLLRLIQYIYHHASDRQVGFVGDDVPDLFVHLFTDADFAGDAVSQRSTTGVHLAVHGPHTIFPIQGLSGKQTAVAFSTPEAEIYAGCQGYRAIMMPALQL